MKLTKAEKDRGWVVYTCPDHGDMCAAPKGCVVRCGDRVKNKKCNKRCRPKE